MQKIRDLDPENSNPTTLWKSHQGYALNTARLSMSTPPILIDFDRECIIALHAVKVPVQAEIHNGPASMHISHKAFIELLHLVEGLRVAVDADAEALVKAVAEATS